MPKSNFQLDFLLDLLQAIQDSDGDPQVVYPLLKKNLDKLDNNFVGVLQSWGKASLAKVDSEEAQVIARVIGNLSNLLQDFPLGRKASSLEIAIIGYKLATTVFTREAFPKEWASTRNNLASAYFYRIEGDRKHNLEVAIRCLKAALKIYTCENFPQEWAMTQNNLGQIYRKRIEGDKARNQEVAIKCYLSALKIYTREDFPQEWAISQYHLANDYSDRIRGDRAENLERAIRYYLSALQVYNYDNFPQEWADIQHDIAATYTDRIIGDKAENLERAIESYQAALQIRTFEALPEDWAMTQNNLGNAYKDRIQGDEAENLEEAIHHLKAALKVYTYKSFPQDWAMSKNNLAIAYTNRIKGDKAENLEEAICHLKAALKVYTYESFPQDWAMIQNNLGYVYLSRIKGGKRKNLEAVISHLQAALKFRNRENFPQDWAETQNNLAQAYRRRVRGNRVENLETAIQHYQNALQIHTRDTLPQDFIKTSFNLGLAYQEFRKITSAYTTFADAIEILEALRDEIVSGDEAKQKLAEEWNELYSNMMKACLDLNKPVEALEYVERSKNRNLVELILRRDLRHIFPSKVADQLQKMQDAIASGQYQLQSASEGDPKGFAQNLQRLRQRRNKLQDRYITVGYGFKFDQFQASLGSHTCIIEWYIAGDKIFTFIVKPNCSTSRSTGNEGESICLTPRSEGQQEEVSVWQSKMITLEDLEDWANAYLDDYYDQKEIWCNHLKSKLEALKKILDLDEIIQQLPRTCHRLILIPHRALHLFPLHALFLSATLFDRFPGGISCAPSCQLLQLAQKRDRPYFNNLFAIQNPTQDLAYTDIEVSAIRCFFDSKETNVLAKSDVTKDAVNSDCFNASNCIHFSCHGYFNLNNPRKSALILANSELTPIPNEIDSEQYLSLQDGRVLDLNQCLTLDSIFSLNLDQCRLVTLSACETGLIDFRNVSDEYIGLPSGFLYAGARSIISSLWAVNDLSTALLMAKFYENLQTESPIAIALNQAQCWLRDSTKVDLETWMKERPFYQSPTIRLRLRQRLHKIPDNTCPFAEPFYWAAFCAVGQP